MILAILQARVSSSRLPGKVLLGAKPTDGNRRLALANHDHVPMVPPYLAETSGGIARGVGVFEFEGKTPGVFKGYFNQPSRLASVNARSM